jgi:hypothetical protein
VKVKRPFLSLLPISNINHPVFFIYLEQECGSPPFTFTLHHMVSQIGQVPESCQNFLRVQINLPAPQAQRGGGGGGFRLLARGSVDPWEAVRETSGLGSIHLPIAFLRGAGALLGGVSGMGSRPHIGTLEPDQIAVP